MSIKMKTGPKNNFTNLMFITILVIDDSLQIFRERMRHSPFCKAVRNKPIKASAPADSWKPIFLETKKQNTDGN